MDVVTIAAALGAGSMAGVFFAFSGFIMAGLDRLPAAQATAAMQAINVTAVRPPLMIALFGTAALCVAAAASGEPLAIGGAAAYLVGAVGVTIVGNVPLNNELMSVGEPVWRRYVSRWTALNTVRAIASLAAAALLAA